MGEDRIIRDRQLAGNAQADRSQPASDDGAARFLGQVYDGGNIGSSPGLFYLLHPASINGAEVEGGSFTPVVDATTSIPVLVLNQVPAVGNILVATGVGGRWVAEKTASNTGCCNAAWSCAPSLMPDTWTIFDRYLGVTVTLNSQGCNDDCHQQDGASVYAKWKGQATVNYPGNTACPAFPNVLVTYYIGCFSTVEFNGDLRYAFWIECGWTGVNETECVGIVPGGSIIQCPGNSPVPDYGAANLVLVLPCVQYPDSLTLSKTAVAAGVTPLGPPWVLHGLDCTTPMDASFVLTPSESSLNCGCTWPCMTLPAPKAFDLTLSGNGKTFGPFRLGKFTAGGNDCGEGMGVAGNCLWAYSWYPVPMPKVQSPCFNVPVGVGGWPKLLMCFDGTAIQFTAAYVQGFLYYQVGPCGNSPYSWSVTTPISPNYVYFDCKDIRGFLYTLLGGVCTDGGCAFANTNPPIQMTLTLTEVP